MRKGVVINATLLSLVAAPLMAQSAAGRLEGAITERIASRSVSSASVTLVRLGTETSVTYSATPDQRGRYHVDSLPAGRYLVQLSSATLDSLDVAIPPSEVKIDRGRTARADLQLPFGAGLRDAVCQGLNLARGKSAVAGRATDADTDQPLAGADVVASWSELSLDRTTLKSTTQRRVAVVHTGPRGEYRMCGVPTGRFISMQLQHAGRAGAVMKLSITEAEGAVVRDLSLSESSAPTIAALDSLERTMSPGDSTREELQLTGTSLLTGIVRGSAGQPLADVQIRVRDARTTASTDSAGRFSLANLPSGTQVLVVRQLGYAAAEIPVELRAGRSTRRDVRLERAAQLDSVKVVADRPRLAEFERNRRTNLLGKYVTLGEIQRRQAKETADLLAPLGIFTVVGKGENAKLQSRGAFVNQPTCKYANIVIDGRLENMQINDVIPSDIEAIEAYRDASSAPASFAGKADCGLVVIWLKPGENPGDRPAEVKRPPPTLRGNGYP